MGSAVKERLTVSLIVGVGTDVPEVLTVGRVPGLLLGLEGSQVGSYLRQIGLTLLHSASDSGET